MRFVRTSGSYGDFYGFEIEGEGVFLWEENCYQNFPMKIENCNCEIEEITSLEFYHWMNEHSKLMMDII